LVDLWRVLLPKMEPENIKHPSKSQFRNAFENKLHFDRCLINCCRPGPSKTCFPCTRDANFRKNAFSRKWAKKLPQHLPETFKKRTHNHEKCPLEIDRKIHTLQKRFFSKRTPKMTSKSERGPPCGRLFRLFSSGIVLGTRKLGFGTDFEGSGLRFWRFFG